MTCTISKASQWETDIHMYSATGWTVIRENWPDRSWWSLILTVFSEKRRRYLNWQRKIITCMDGSMHREIPLLWLHQIPMEPRRSAAAMSSVQFLTIHCLLRTADIIRWNPGKASTRPWEMVRIWSISLILERSTVPMNRRYGRYIRQEHWIRSCIRLLSPMQRAELSIWKNMRPEILSGWRWRMEVRRRS